MKYGTFKYGEFLYGIWRGAGVYIRAAVVQVIQAAGDVFDNTRMRTDILPVVAIEASVAPSIDITSDVLPPIEVEL